MNCNKKIIDALAPTNLPVVQDEYEGSAKKYIVFIYTDETPALWGDDGVLADTVFLQVQLITPKDFNYFTLKHQIRDLLEADGFLVTSTQSMLGDIYNGTEKVRQTIFEIQFSETRQIIGG